jgi:FAD/FMN-containing dehydrogenase
LSGTRATRRSVLKRIGAAAACTPALLAGRPAVAQQPPLPPLPNLTSSEVLLLRPGDADFAAYQPAFNARTMLTPQLRALCKTAKAVGTMVDWCRSNNLPFAMRCGGHSYEGFSESSSVVIDTRLMSAIKVDAATKTVTVGAGASLGAIYKALAPRNLAFAAGSCPTVGVSGHTLGGGYGYLARPFGLTCDNLLAVDLVDPQGRQVHADATQNADLFWACRGGGGGSFGVATAFRFKLRHLANVLVFRIDWTGLDPSHAAVILKDWQAWLPQAPSSIDATFLIRRHADGAGLDLRCSGQSIGSRAELERALRPLSSSPQIRPMSFFDAVNYFAGGKSGWTYSSAPMKGKSDYVVSPLTDDGIGALMNRVSTKPSVYVICDAYGGAIARVGAEATAFAHRSALFSVQYGSTWSDPNDTAQRLADMRELYAAMRPYVSGAAYVNYCDLDRIDWQNAYWGSNLARLRQIKSAFDAGNVFRHAQSVPPA